MKDFKPKFGYTVDAEGNKQRVHKEKSQKVTKSQRRKANTDKFYNNLWAPIISGRLISFLRGRPVRWVGLDSSLD